MVGIVRIEYRVKVGKDDKPTKSKITGGGDATMVVNGKSQGKRQGRQIGEVRKEMGWWEWGSSRNKMHHPSPSPCLLRPGGVKGKWVSPYDR